MSKQTINIGASPNDGTGTPLRTSFDYTNQNFTELYTALGGGVGLPGATTQVIFNDGGTNLAGDAGLVYNKTTDALTVAGLVTAGSATITGAATVGTTLGVTGVSTLTGNAFANGSATVAAGTPGAFANAALTINNRGGVSDLSLIALGYRPNGTVLNGAAYIGFITTSGSGNVLGDLIFGTRSVTTDTAPTERYRIDSTGISTWSVAGTTAMTLDSTGLGIGAVANAKLDVAGAATVVDSRGQLYIHTTDAAAIDVGAQLTLGGVYTGSNNYAFGGIAARKENGTTNVAGYLDFLTTTSAGALTSRMRIDSTGNVGIGVTPSAKFHSKAGAVTLGGIIETGGASSLLSFADVGTSSYTRVQIGSVGNTLVGIINGVQAMTLDASGRLFVGKTSSSAANTGCELQTGTGGNAASVFTADAGSASIMNRLTSDGTIIDFRRETLSVGNIAVTTLATTYNSISDYRLKEAVQPLVGGLARVSALKPSIYKWKVNGSDGEGFLAHELASVVSAAVTGEKDAVNEDGSINAQSIDMSRIVPILVAAIQELTARVQTLEAR